MSGWIQAAMQQNTILDKIGFCLLSEPFWEKNQESTGTPLLR